LLLMLSSGASMLDVAPLHAQATTSVGATMSGRGAPQVSASDYARAEALIGWNARELVVDDAVAPRWIPGNRFWYRNRGVRGYEFLLVDATTGAKRPLFDNARLAAELS
jgi:hypothetical protein